MSVEVAIVRHASAGDRAGWRGDDALRPLDKRGRSQAAAIADLLGQHPLARIASSPAVRCLQTVESLAAATGRAVEPLSWLAEGSDPDLGEILGRGRRASVVLCSHGDVIGRLIGFDRPCRKGSIWLCTWAGGQLEPRTYIRRA